MELLILLVISGAVFGFIGMAIGDLGNKKNGSIGFLLGALLGPIGCIVVALLPPADSEVSTGHSPAPDPHQAKIALLEAQLAELKKPAPTAKKSVKPLDDDESGIPTYKLD